MLKGTVPLFNQDYDLSKPAEIPSTFASMALAGAMAIGAIGAGQWLINRTRDAAGQDGDPWEAI